MPTDSKSLALVRGALPRSLAKADRRALINRETHHLVLVATKDGFADDPAFHWLADLRRGRLRIYGGLLRFIDISVMRKVPKPVLMMIPEWIRSYIEDAYEGGDGPKPASTAKVA